jgi:imidazolonepropionase-like amidohydrolase
MKIFKLLFLLLVSAINVYSQNPAPAKENIQRILYLGATAHIGNGEVIENSAIGFANGKFTLIADARTIKIDRTAFDTIITLNGRHIYPGFIALNTVLGINEIEAVRATNDFNETGAINPSARTLPAYNTDSKVIPTVRTNGILLAQVVPAGGILSGQSSVMMTDGWNYEDAVYKEDIGIHLNWPSMRIIKGGKADQEEKQKENSENQLADIRKLFEDAKAYSLASNTIKNLHLEAMKGLFNGSKKLFVHCNYVKEIIAAVSFCRDMNISMVLVGGTDSRLVPGLLKENKIPVILMETHRLPTFEDEDADMPYKLPAILKNAGITFAITTGGFWQTRNLPFQAGTAAAYGITKEEALMSITLNAATILGIENITGSLTHGKDANFIISTGDMLDMKSCAVETAYIRGRKINLDNIQLQLNKKFRNKYGLE